MERLVLIIVTLGLFKIFRLGGFADPIGSVKPAAKVHVLAARAAEGTKGRIFIAGDGNAPMTGWTLERRHNYARRSTRITDYELEQKESLGRRPFVIYDL